VIALTTASNSWFTPFDSDPDMAADTRRRLTAEYADSQVLLIGTHFPPERRVPA
jgi:hypothetical protein